MADWGVTSNGFVMPTLPELIEGKETTAKELYGSNVDTEVWSSLGMFIRTIAAQDLITYQDMQSLYYVPYLDFAYGQNLDDLLEMFAFRRRNAEKATGYVAFTGAIGTSIAGSTTIKTTGENPISFKTVDPLTITEMVTNGEFTTDTASWTAENGAVLASVPGGADGNCLQITRDNAVPPGTDDPYAEQQIAVTEFLFYDLSVLVKKGTEATYNVDVHDVTNSANIFASGDLEANDGDWDTIVTQRIEIPEDCSMVAIRLNQISSAGSTTLLFDSVSFTAVGTNIIAVDAALAGNVPSNNVIILETPISGIVSVTNVNATIGGRDKELDNVYRARYKLSTMVVGNATLNSIVSSVLGVTNVSSATIEENDTAIDYSNRLLNSGFDSDASHWYATNGTISFDAAAGIGGGGCLKVTGNGADNDPYGYQIVHVTPGDVYTLTVYIKEGTEQDYIVSVRDLDDASAAIGADCTGTEIAGDWSTSCVKSAFTIPAGCYSIEVRFGQSAIPLSNTIFFDSSLLHLDPAGLPPNSVRVSVQGGTNADVAQALLDSVAGGIQTYGDESGTGTLDNGQIFTRKLTRPNEILIYVAAAITSDATYAGADAVETAIIDYIGGKDADSVIHAGLGAGDNVLFYEIISAIMDVTGVTNVVLGISDNVAPSPPVGTSDIAISATEAAHATTTSIVIT